MLSNHFLVDAAIFSCKLGMCAILHLSSFLEDDDTISFFNCGQTVRNDESGDFLTVFGHLRLHIIDGFLDLSFVGLVKGASSFIENQHFRLLDECSGKGKSLLLTTR